MISLVSRSLLALSDRLVLLSGGVDSSSLLALCAEQGVKAQPLFVDYGQRAAAPELAAAESVSRAYGVVLRQATAGIGDVAAGEIPGRNALLVHLALAMSPPTPAAIMLGIHAGTPYRDCSPAFVEAMQVSLDLHREGTLQLAAPFLTWSKHEVYSYARASSVPLDLTYSCEAGNVPPCGACPSCRDRKLLDAGA
jgi:7-cyano-7-deazaguanine synthase